MQGVVGGRDFLITSPIALHSRVTVDLSPEFEGVRVESELNFGKTLKAVSLLLRTLGAKHLGARLRVETPVPRSKGLASSTADLAAALHACAEALGHALPPYLLSRIAADIEPSDAVFFPGSVIYDHLRGEILEFLGAPPPLSFVIIDTGGEVDTLGFDRERARAHARASEAQVARAMALVRQGFRQQVPALVAEGATLSARCHQAVLFKPWLEELLRATRELGVLGINCGHSGTVLGLMFDPTRHDGAPIAERAAQITGPGRLLGIHRLISGGTRLLRSSRQGLSQAQQSSLDTLGEPLTRVPVRDGMAIAFEHGPERRRIFVLPDGQRVSEPPDPLEGLCEPRAVPVPREGEAWEMRVSRLSEEEGVVRYLPGENASGLRAAPRLLSRALFEAAFTLQDGVFVRRVRVVKTSEGRVTYAAPDGAHIVLPVPLFLSAFQRSPLAAESHRRTDMSSAAVDKEGSERLAHYLSTQQVDASLVRPGQEMPTVPLAAVALGVGPEQIVKSILFEGKKDRERVVLAIAPGDVRVSAAKVGAAAGVSQLKLASPDTVLRTLGYAVGGVPPVGHATPVAVVVDARVLNHAFVFGGGGDEHHMLRITPQDIVRLTEARVADVVADPEPRQAP